MRCSLVNSSKNLLQRRVCNADIPNGRCSEEVGGRLGRMRRFDLEADLVSLQMGDNVSWAIHSNQW